MNVWMKIQTRLDAFPDRLPGNWRNPRPLRADRALELLQS